MKKLIAVLVVLALSLCLVPAAYSGSVGQVTPTNEGTIKKDTVKPTLGPNFAHVYMWYYFWYYFIWNNNRSW